MVKLTMDIGLTNGVSDCAFMKRLFRWKEAGLVELVEAQPGRKTVPEAAPARTPAPFARRSSVAGLSTRGRSTPIAGSGQATFKSLAGILFPGRDSAKLRMQEINEVVYLIRHHSIQNDIFVTNTRHYIDDGHQERLKSAFGIVAMTPKETVAALSHTLKEAEVAAK
jgi:hypothetical protein